MKQLIMEQYKHEMIDTIFIAYTKTSGARLLLVIHTCPYRGKVFYTVEEEEDLLHIGEHFNDALDAFNMFSKVAERRLV